MGTLPSPSVRGGSKSPSPSPNRRRAAKMGSPVKLTKATFQDVALFFSSLMQRKVELDAAVGFDPERTPSFETFMFNEVLGLAQGNIMSCKLVLSDYLDTIAKEALIL
jgi:hypothetical protein